MKIWKDLPSHIQWCFTFNTASY